MAGSEKSGYSNSKAMLIENAYYILTPTEEVAPEKVSAFETFIESLRALPVVLDYRQHDQITGTIKPSATSCRQPCMPGAGHGHKG